MCNFFIFLCFLQLKDPGRQMLQNVYRALKKVYHVNFMLTKFSPLNSEKSFNMKQKKKSTIYAHMFNIEWGQIDPKDNIRVKSTVSGTSETNNHAMFKAS